MTYEAFGTLGILLLAIVLFLSEKLRPDLIALLTVALFAGAGILTPQEAFSGFGSGAVVLIASVFVLAEGLNRTGASEAVARLLLRLGGRSEGLLVTAFMTAGGLLSLFMNNIAAAAVLLPSAGKAAERSGVPVSRLLIPLVFATILGGMATLLTTMNLVVGTVLEESGLSGFGLLDFLPVGLPALVAGIVYMTFWGRFRLSSDRGTAPLRSTRDPRRLFGLYGMEEHFFHVRIPSGSYLDGRKLGESTLREAFRLSLIAVTRHGVRLGTPTAETVLHEGDVLTVRGRASEFADLDREPRLEILESACSGPRDIEPAGSVLAEVMLSPRSSLIGSTLRDVRFLQRYGMNVVAVWREGEAIRRDIRTLSLRYGDALLGVIPEEKLVLLQDNPDLIPLTASTGAAASRRRAPVALGVIAATLLTAILSPLPLAQVFFTGAVVLVLTRTVTVQQAYRAVDWRVVILVGGMLPTALAMQRSGAAGILSDFLIRTLGQATPLLPTAALFLVAALLTQAVSGAAVAAILAPVAASMALSTSVPPHALGMAVALGASMAFLTPLGHPVNLLVMGAGGYRFRDYLRVGWPLFLLLAGVILGMLTLRWGLLGA